MAELKSELKAKFAAVTSKSYSEQAKFFLNAFWTFGMDKEVDNIWKYAQKCIELDIEKKKNGNELDEFKAHNFLEAIGETRTVVELRETLRKIDIDMNKKMALTEFLLFKYSKTVEELVNLPQGDQKQIEEAQAKLQAVNDALQELQKQLDIQQRDLMAQREAEAAAKQSEAAAKESETAAKEAEAAAKQSEAAAKQSEHAAKRAEVAAKESEAAAKRAEIAAKESEIALKQAEGVVKQAEIELKAAVDDLYKQEQEYNNQVKALEDEINNENTKSFNRSKAANVLAQLKQENPLPLRKAKITQEAALRRVEKERKKAEEAARKAEDERKIAEEAAAKAEDERKIAEEAANFAALEARKAEEQKKRVEEAVNETEKKLQEATEYLEHVKKSSVPRGALWWIERELKDAQRFLPKKKQTL